MTEHGRGFFFRNHVNLFDPFVIYSAIPQFVRGFELESHFKVPIYGWMMGRFGNIPVPDKPSREGLELMRSRGKAAIDSGISLIVFPGGIADADGACGRVQEGDLRIRAAIWNSDRAGEHCGVLPIFSDRQLDAVPERITVILHDTIETVGIAKADVDALRQRVQDIVSEPVEVSLRENPVQKVCVVVASGRQRPARSSCQV